MTSPLDDAFDQFLQAIAGSADFVRHHPFYEDPENRAAAYAFLTSMTIARLEEDVVFDADHPFFRVIDTRIREGGDNPDQRYLLCNLNGGDTYRIWGTLGSARRIDLQIYSGTPYVPGSGGRAASFLSFEDIAFGPSGSFDIVASPRRQPGNWIENPADATRVLARQVFSDWSPDAPGDMHIDRAGHEGALKPRLTEDGMAARLRRAAVSLDTHVRVWPGMVADDYLARLPPNELSVPFDPGTVGGVPGRWMCHSTFDLGDDDALVITTWPASGNYQGIQLADLWFSSLEYANRQTSLTADQAQLSADGAFRFVVSTRDPGIVNWLDTTGRRRGVILLRYDGMTETTFDPARSPRAARVPFAELATVLPADTPRVSPEQRRDQIAARRVHIQRRYGI